MRTILNQVERLAIPQYWLKTLTPLGKKNNSKVTEILNTVAWRLKLYKYCANGITFYTSNL